TSCPLPCVPAGPGVSEPAEPPGPPGCPVPVLRRCPTGRSGPGLPRPAAPGPLPRAPAGSVAHRRSCRRPRGRAYGGTTPSVSTFPCCQSGGPEPARTTHAARQLRDLDQPGPLHPLHHQLGDAVAAVQPRPGPEDGVTPDP